MFTQLVFFFLVNLCKQLLEHGTPVARVWILKQHQIEQSSAVNASSSIDTAAQTPAEMAQAAAGRQQPSNRKQKRRTQVRCEQLTSCFAGKLCSLKVSLL